MEWNHKAAENRNTQVQVPKMYLVTFHCWLTCTHLCILVALKPILLVFGKSNYSLHLLGQMKISILLDLDFSSISYSHAICTITEFGHCNYLEIPLIHLIFQSSSTAEADGSLVPDKTEVLEKRKL